MTLRIGQDSEFAALRAALERSGFTEEGVCSRLGIERMSGYRLQGDRYFDREPDDPTGILIWLLLEGRPVSSAGSAKIPLRELAALGVLKDASATVMLHPMHGLYIASDRPRPEEDPAEGKPGRPPDDFVYPAIVANTDLFLHLLPPTPCDAFLDLCSGTGIAAMVAARFGAAHAWAYDVTQRSTHFAEFNRRLNALPNVTASRGDLYEPAGDLTFDRIAAHPPYVPVYRPQLIFDSGGQDGEQIVRRIIEGLPRYLRPGGRFFALTMGTDRERPFEQRLRNWLGEAEKEFDVAFVVRRVLTPRDYAAEAVIRNRGRVEDIQSWREMFARLRIEGLPYGFLTLQRRDRPRPVFTVRRQTGERTGPGEHSWLVEWETSIAAGGAETLLSSRPRAAQGVGLHVEQRMTREGWEAREYRLEVDHPFRMETRAQAWTAHLLALADGSRTGVELLEQMKTDGALHAETPAVEYSRMLALLVSGGFLEV